MELNDETKALIDAMTLPEMLELWRNAPTGHPMFQDESGTYFGEVMKRKRAEDPAGWTAASKAIGWGGPR